MDFRLTDEQQALQQNVRQVMRRQLEDVTTWAAGDESILFQRTLKKDLYASLPNDLARISLLTERMHPELKVVGVHVPTRTN